MSFVTVSHVSHPVTSAGTQARSQGEPVFVYNDTCLPESCSCVGLFTLQMFVHHTSSLIIAGVSVQPWDAWLDCADSGGLGVCQLDTSIPGVCQAELLEALSFAVPEILSESCIRVHWSQKAKGEQGLLSTPSPIEEKLIEDATQYIAFSRVCFNCQCHICCSAIRLA